MAHSDKESSLEQKIYRCHYFKLYDYLSSSDSEVTSLTNSLYSEGIIGKPIKDKIHTSKGTSAGDKACILLNSVESAITTHSKHFQTFCSILAKISDNLKKLSDEIISEYDARQKPRVNKYESCSEVLPLSNKNEIQEEWHQPSKKSTPSSSQTFSEADGVTPPTERSEVESKPSNSHLLDDEHSILQPNYCSQFSIHMASEELEVSEAKKLIMDPKPSCQSLSRAFSSQLADIPDTVDVPDLNNPASQIFNRHYNDLVNAIANLGPKVADEMADILSTHNLISIAEKDRVHQLSSVPIKVKAILSSLGANIERGRKDNDQLTKFLTVLHDKWQHVPTLIEVVVKMRRDASISPMEQTETIVVNTPTSTIVGAGLDMTTESCTSLSKRDDDDDSVIFEYANYLKSQYKMDQKPDNKWPHIFKKFIDVDLAEVTELDQADDEFSRSTIRGNFEDVIRKKVKISSEYLQRKIKNCSRILLEGAPGIGKSTLVLEYCRKWGKGELFTDYDLIVILPLRDKTVQKAKCPSDLFFIEDDESLGKNVSKALSRHRGKGLFIILEGFDELSKEFQGKDSIFIKLLDGKMFPDATVMVTTRHSATVHLQSLTKANFQLHLEISGFSESTIKDYISISFKNKADIMTSFNDYLDQFPHIKGCLYVPLNLAILTEIFSQKQRPETLTELYTAIVKTQLLRYLDDIDLRFEKIEDLSKYKKRPEIFTKFCKVCEFAYDNLCDQTLVFHELSEELETLDLIQKESHFQIHSGISYSYSFLHPTFQEFLAAYHMYQLYEDDQQKLYNFLTKKQSFIVVLRFFAGLTGFRSIKLTFPRKISDFNLIQQLFESKNERLTKHLLENPDKLQHIFRTWPTPTLQDFYALGWCIRLSNCKWHLGFSFRALSSHHIAMLKKGISEDPTGQIEMMTTQLNPIGNEGFNHLLGIAPKALENVSILGLRGMNLDSSASNELAKKLSHTFSHLRKLHFHDNPIECGGHEQLIKALCNVPSLKEVSFSKLSPVECSTLLTKTSIGKIVLWQLSHNSLQAISLSIANAQSCLLLRIHDSEVTSENVASLPQVLHKNIKLRSLELINCSISCETTEMITNAVTTNSSIRNLNLDNNMICDKDAYYIIDMLKNRKTHLKSINVNRNPIGKRLLDKITRKRAELSLKWKKEIHSHLFHSNPIYI